MGHEMRVYNDPDEDLEDDLRPEYDFSELKLRPNPYTERARQRKLEATEEKAKDDQSREG